MLQVCFQVLLSSGLLNKAKKVLTALNYEANNNQPNSPSVGGNTETRWHVYS